MNTLRQKYKALRNTFNGKYLTQWQAMEDQYKTQNLTPEQWVKKISEFALQMILERSIQTWFTLRLENPEGWPKPALTQIKGWHEDLHIASKISLVKNQIKQDQETMDSYEEYLANKW